MAGVDKDARSAVESIVVDALGPRADAAEWTISLVKLADKWSVTVDGPGERFRGLSLTADEERLGEAIREAIGEGGRRSAAAAASAVERPALGEARTRCSCERCGKMIIVVYEPQPNDPLVPAAVACPHCWAINHVEIGGWAAAGREYRAEKG